LTVVDYFAMSNEVSESAADLDLGSGGAMLLPDMVDDTGVVRHLVVGAGKDGNIYLVNRDAMGGFSPSRNNIWQQLTGVVSDEIRSTPAYFNNSIYYAERYGPLKAFSLTNAKLSASPTSHAKSGLGYPGTIPAISANGSTNGIVWAPDSANGGILHAYNAADLSNEIYNSTQAPGGRDSFGAVVKFTAPTIADGKVFVGTHTGVGVFGLLH